jgi:hypothetical protein
MPADWLSVQAKLWLVASHAGYHIGADGFDRNGHGKNSGCVRHKEWRLHDMKKDELHYQPDWMHLLDRQRGATYASVDVIEARIRADGGWRPGNYNVVTPNCWHFVWWLCDHCL